MVLRGDAGRETDAARRGFAELIPAMPAISGSRTHTHTRPAPQGPRTAARPPWTAGPVVSFSGL